MRVHLFTELDLVPEMDAGTFRQWLEDRGRSAMGYAEGGIDGLWSTRDQPTGTRLLLLTRWPDEAAAGAAVELLKASTLVVAVRGTPLHGIPQDGTPLRDCLDWAAVDRFVHLQLPATTLPAFLAALQQGRTDATRAFLAPGPDATTRSLLLAGPEDVALPIDARIIDLFQAQPLAGSWNAASAA
ncbi:MAG: hypothetical protein V2I63_02465 [Pseudomonadales bacterium]|jgi:hypothetical protein|nr:hypothetical protein [Pseudomonadales bacterium]